MIFFVNNHIYEDYVRYHKLFENVENENYTIRHVSSFLKVGEGALNFYLKLFYLII